MDSYIPAYFNARTSKSKRSITSSTSSGISHFWERIADIISSSFTTCLQDGSHKLVQLNFKSELYQYSSFISHLVPRVYDVPVLRESKPILILFALYCRRSFGTSYIKTWELILKIYRHVKRLSLSLSLSNP